MAALYESIRSKPNEGIPYYFQTENLNRGTTPTKKLQASSLLRTCGLVALTHTEYSNANSEPLIETSEIIKTFPYSDVMWPFNNNSNCLPLKATNDTNDREVVNKELSINKTQNALQNFWIQNNQDRLANGWLQDQINRINQGVRQVDGNNGLTPEIIIENYNRHIRNNIDNINFFDKINVLHNQLIASFNLYHTAELKPCL